MKQSDESAITRDQMIVRRIMNMYAALYRKVCCRKRVPIDSPGEYHVPEDVEIPGKRRMVYAAVFMSPCKVLA